MLAVMVGCSPLLLTACGGHDGNASGTVVTIEPTSYVTRPPVTTPPAPGASLPTGAQPGMVYEAQSGDYWNKIASMYQVSLDELTAYNDKTPQDDLYPGDQIKIPPNGIPPAAETESTDPNVITADGTTDPRDDAVTARTIDTSCAQGTYTIKAGDYPGKVAGAFDLTVEQLNAANQSTTGYGAFYEGLKIVIPCVDGGSDTTAA